jgi:hypothetical protein
MNDPLNLADIHAGGFPVSLEDLCPRDGTTDPARIEE